MKYIKCPRCELNYITPDKELCDVCLRQVSGKDSDAEFCCICGALLSELEFEVCTACLNESEKEKSVE